MLVILKISHLTWGRSIFLEGPVGGGCHDEMDRFVLNPSEGSRIPEMKKVRCLVEWSRPRTRPVKCVEMPDGRRLRWAWVSSHLMLIVGVALLLTGAVAGVVALIVDWDSTGDTCNAGVVR